MNLLKADLRESSLLGKRQDGGFITLIVILLAVLVGAVVVAYIRVKARQ